MANGVSYDPVAQAAERARARRSAVSAILLLLLVLLILLLIAAATERTDILKFAAVAAWPLAGARGLVAAASPER
jgi:uncharacterized integral membrane protein